MKNTLFIVMGLVLILGLVVFLLGENVEPSVFIEDFTVSEAGDSMELSVSVASSAGYVRKYKDAPHSHAHYLRFYSALGGPNGKIGAKSRYTLPLSPDDTAVYIKRSGGYQLALEKVPSGEWVRVE